MLEDLNIIDNGCKIAKTTKSILPKTVDSLDTAGSYLVNIINTVLSPFEMAHLYSKHAIKNLQNKLENKLNDIPYECRCKPKLSTVGPIIDSLKYNLNEESLHDMYANLLAKSCNNKLSEDILPTFAEIIKQITPLEATVLPTFLSVDAGYSICDIRLQKKGQYYNRYNHKLHDKSILKNYTEGIDVFSNYFPYNLSNIPSEKLSLMIDNWLRLKLIEIDDHVYISENSYYNFYYDENTKRIIEDFKSMHKNINFDEKNYEPAHIPKSIHPTLLGRSFYKICIED